MTAEAEHRHHWRFAPVPVEGKYAGRCIGCDARRDFPAAPPDRRDYMTEDERELLRKAQIAARTVKDFQPSYLGGGAWED